MKRILLLALLSPFSFPFPFPPSCLIIIYLWVERVIDLVPACLVAVEGKQLVHEVDGRGQGQVHACGYFVCV
jgi:hypothetical protein